MTLPTPLYSIGEPVYCARSEWSHSFVQCPDCLGTKSWSVTTPSGDTFPVPCSTCDGGGWDGPQGRVKVYDDRPSVEALTIGSVRMDTNAKPEEERVSYMCHETGVGSGTIWYESRLFRTYEGAHAAATVLAHESRQRRAEQEAERVARERRKARRRKRA